LKFKLVVGIILCFFVVSPLFSEPRNVLLITIDTIRADHLSCNGSLKVQTPNLDRVARDGINFTRARASVPLTLPSHASIMTSNLGIILYRQRDLNPAKQELEKAIALDQQNVTTHCHLGNVLRSLGDFKGAIEQYQHALEINPRYVYAANGLGLTYSAQKKEGEALRYFRQAVTLDPEIPSVIFNLAAQLEHMGQSKEALQTYNRFMELSAGKEFNEQRQRAVETIKRLEGK
jgi:tetratricopeptide (TPR) repeat protein